MAEIRISVPDGLLHAAYAADLDISLLASAALATELDRLSESAELDRYLEQLVQRPVTQTWIDELLSMTRKRGGEHSTHER
jgi:hypothetical protein